MASWIKRVFVGISILVAVVLTGCTKAPNNSVDPAEKFNRQMFAFDMALDKAVFRPAAIIYDSTFPPPIKQGVTNFFDNIEEITIFPNDILQGKLRYATIDLWRFILNTTLGFGGIFDPASRAGLPKHYQDFGLTFAYWDHGKESPYFVIPIMGPSTLRDAVGKLADYAASPWPYIQPWWMSSVILSVKWVNLRSQLLPADKLLQQAFDPYIFVRDAYLQRRHQLIEENALGDYDPNRMHASDIEASAVEVANATPVDGSQTEPVAVAVDTNVVVEKPKKHTKLATKKSSHKIKVKNPA